MIRVICGDNLQVLNTFKDAQYSLVYIDPPFNTGRKDLSYVDSFEDYLAFLRPRLEEGYRVLKKNGSFFVHLDWREVHYAKILMDLVFGRENFMNEIIWAYDYGARSRRKWPTKHDSILWYVKDRKNYTFNFDEMDRIPYMAPGLVGEEKAKRGKTPTDVWWHTIVPTNGKERVGYPTQKPIGVLSRIIKVHTSPGDHVLDFFAGSGTTGVVALRLGRHCDLVDNSEDAVRVMRQRLTVEGWLG